MQESSTGSVELHDDDPMIVEALLKYLYTGTYDEGQYPVSPCVVNVRVFALAEKYAISGLEKMAAEKFFVSALSKWPTDGFAEAIHEAYTCTSDPDNLLRDGILKVVMNYFDELFKPDDPFLRFKQTLVEAPDFAADAAQLLALGYDRERNMAFYRCPNQQCTQGIFKSDMKPGQKATWSCPHCAYFGSPPFARWQKRKVEVLIVEAFYVDRTGKPVQDED